MGETNCRGTYSTGKTMRLTSKNLILNTLLLEYYQFWEIRILILLVEEFPGRIMTYNLDFRGFWLSKGGTTIFQKKHKIIFEFNCPRKKKCHVEGTILIHLCLNAPLKFHQIEKILSAPNRRVPNPRFCDFKGRVNPTRTSSKEHGGAEGNTDLKLAGWFESTKNHNVHPGLNPL